MYLATFSSWMYTQSTEITTRHHLKMWVTPYTHIHAVDVKFMEALLDSSVLYIYM